MHVHEYNDHMYAYDFYLISMLHVLFTYLDVSFH